jgi:putative membrane protein
VRRSRWGSGSERTTARLIIRFLISALAVWVASIVVPGITPLLPLPARLPALLLVTVIFGVVNALIKPLFRFITCPIEVLTLGLFTLIINAAMLGLTSWIAEHLGVNFAVNGFLAAFLGALLISVISWALSTAV